MGREAHHACRWRGLLQTWWAWAPPYRYAFGVFQGTRFIRQRKIGGVLDSSADRKTSKYESRQFAEPDAGTIDEGANAPLLRKKRKSRSVLFRWYARSPSCLPTIASDGRTINRTVYLCSPSSAMLQGGCSTSGASLQRSRTEAWILRSF